MEHPNELDQQLENLRTLQQSYDQIAGAAEAYNVGKTELAAAITAKGVATDPTETYPEMADKVTQIVQTQQVIDGGEMYAKQLFGSLTTPNYWNLYEIMAQLLSDGRLVNYGGILLAEYYKGYDSLALSGAGAGGAYVVSDKDSDGNFIMYTNDTTHTWDTEDDGKGNRWVAYCFADEYHDFQITDTNTSPRSIYIGRNVGTITSLVKGRVSQIVVPDGNSLGCFSSKSYAQNFGREIVIRNLQNQNVSLPRLADATELVYISAAKIDTGNTYLIREAELSVSNLSSIIIKCGDLQGVLFTNSGTYSDPNIVKYISIKADYARARMCDTNQYLNYKNLRNLVICGDDFQLDFTLNNNIERPTNLHIFIGYESGYDKSKLVKLYNIYNNSALNGWRTVEDLELQDCWCKQLTISDLTSLTEANMYAYILQRLKQDEPDCGDGVTITLGATNLAKLTSQESIDLLDALTNTYGYTFA